MANVTQSRINKRDIESGVHRIEKGLYLRVRGDSMSWILRIQSGGIRKDISLGTAPEIPLALARTKAAKLRLALAEGQVSIKNPKPKTQTDMLFSEICEDALRTKAETRMWKNPRVHQQWRQTIRDVINPAIGDKVADDIGIEDVLAILKPIWKTKSPTAKKVRERLEEIFSHAILKGWYHKPNPAVWRGNLSLVLPPLAKVHKIKHLEAITIDEAKCFAKKFFTSQFISHSATLFGMICVCRLAEFRLAKWSEVDIEKGTLKVPDERRKTGGGDYEIPLPHQLIEMLKTLPRNGDFVFQIDGKPLSYNTCRKVLRDSTKRAVTMHGCRSTFRDWCARNGVDDKVAEACLSHAIGSKTVLAYLRDPLLELRKELLQRWADELLSD